MKQRLAQVALVIDNYDAALEFYCGTLKFVLIEDTFIPDQDKRWVVVSPPGSDSEQCNILLARASSPRQRKAIGNQTGGRVFLFLQTDDFWRDFKCMRRAGVTFVREPLETDYGIVAVFEDPYGNRWDLIQYS